MKRTLSLLALLGVVTIAMPAPVVGSERVVLANGLEAVVVERHARPIVAIEGCSKGGGRAEGQAEKGLTHFVEHLVGRGGTERQSREEWSAAKSRLGWGAWTNADGVCFRMLLPSSDVEEAIWRLADAVFGLTIDDVAVELERDVILQELARGRDGPFGRATHALYPAAFRRHAYGTMTIGREEVLRKVDAVSLRRFYRERFRPNRFVLVVVGDVEPVVAGRAIESAFGGLEPGGGELTSTSFEPPQSAFRWVSTERSGTTDELLLGCRIPAAADPSAATVLVLGAVVEERLQTALMGRGAASVWTWTDLRHGPSLLQIGVAVGAGAATASWAALWDELTELAEEGPSAEVTRRARAALAIERDSYAAHASDLAIWALRESWALAELVDERLATVTAEAVRRAAAELLRPSRCTLAVVSTEAVGEPAFRAVADRVEQAWPSTIDRRSPALERSTPADGLEVVVKTVPGSDVQAVAVVFPRQGVGDAAVRAVVAELLPRLGREPLAESVAAAGGRLEVETNADWVELVASGRSERFSAVVGALVDALGSRSVSAEELERARRAALARLAGRTARAESVAVDRLNRALFGERHPYGRMPAAAAIEAVDAGAARRFLDRELEPREGSWAFVGPSEVGDVAGWIAPLERPSEGPAGSSEAWPQPIGSDARREVEHRDLAQVKVAFGVVGPSWSDGDHPAFRVAGRVLWSRLFHAFVRGDAEPIAYRLVASQEDGRGQRPLVVDAGVVPGTERELVAGVIAEALALCDAGPSDEELDRAAEALGRRLAVGADGNTAEAELLARWSALGADLEQLDRVPARYATVTLAEVAKAACRYLAPEGWRLALVGPVDTASP